MNVQWSSLSKKLKVIHFNSICTLSVSVADPDLQIREGGGGGGHGHPDPEIRGVSKTSFLALWASVWSKNKAGGGAGPPGPSHGSATEYSSS